MIYFPAEKSAQELQTYAQELDFPWPSVNFQKRQTVMTVTSLIGKGTIPSLTVVDRFGKRVIDSQTGRDAVMGELQKLLEQGG